MKFRVTWDPDAFRELLRQWVAAGKPEAGIRAFDSVETVLSTDAHLRGESREANQRILFEPPIGVIFEARQDLAEALILDAWLIAQRGR